MSFVNFKPGDWVKLEDGRIIHVRRFESHFGDAAAWGATEQYDHSPAASTWFEPSRVVEVVRHEPYYALTDEDRAAVAAYWAGVDRVQKAMPWLPNPARWVVEEADRARP